MGSPKVLSASACIDPNLDKPEPKEEINHETTKERKHEKLRR